MWVILLLSFDFVGSCYLIDDLFVCWHGLGWVCGLVYWLVCLCLLFCFVWFVCIRMLIVLIVWVLMVCVYCKVLLFCYFYDELVYLCFLLFLGLMMISWLIIDYWN